MSQIVDVSIALLKKWSDDGFIVPGKTPLGYFRYNKQHVDFILADDFLAKRNEFYNKKENQT
jgi:predicted site-specific integrase-resolvase